MATGEDFALVLLLREPREALLFHATASNLQKHAFLHAKILDWTQSLAFLYVQTSESLLHLYGSSVMRTQIKQWIVARKVTIVCGLGSALLLWALTIAYVRSGNDQVLRMSAGTEGTRRHEVATFLTELAAKNKLHIHLESSEGSEDSLNKLKSGQLDLAIVSNGVIVPDDNNVKVLAATQTEFVHFLVRKKLIVGGAPMSEILRGKRVNLGVKGSMEWLLAQELLSFTRIKLPSESQPGDIRTTEYGKADLISKAHAIIRAETAAKSAMIEEMPDCLVVLAAMPSHVVQLLVEAVEYQLMPLPVSRAFLMNTLQVENGKTAVLDHAFLERGTIPANSYFLNQGYPATDCETISVRMLVVARKDLSDSTVRMLMKTLFEGEYARRITTKSPREVTSPYELHPAAVAYLDRDKPLLVQELLESFTKGFSIFGALSALLLSIYGLLKRKKIRKPSDYYAEIRKVEMIARGSETDQHAPIHPRELMKYLDDRLVKLRCELIEDICNGRIKADQVIANILTLLKDARANLPYSDADLSTNGKFKPHIPDWTRLTA